MHAILNCFNINKYENQGVNSLIIPFIKLYDIIYCVVNIKKSGVLYENKNFIEKRKYNIRKRKA